jgi:hypothetical protein
MTNCFKTALLSRDEASMLHCGVSLHEATPFSRGALWLARREEPAWSMTILHNESVRSAGDGERLKRSGE